MTTPVLTRTNDERPPATRRWRPYFVLFAILAGALLLNLMAANPLWIWYTVLGACALALLWSLDARLEWRIPKHTLYWAGVPFGMHYVGGSLSGFHQFGGVNGLYWIFPWWDNVVHFLGSGAAAVAIVALASRHVHARTPLTLIGIAGGATLGLLVELYEFAGFAWFQTVDQGYYTNTMLDVYYNLLGATAFALAYAHSSAASPSN